MRTGIQRLAIFAAALAAGAVILFFSYLYFVYATEAHPLPRYITIVAIFAAIAAGSAWSIVRGLGWVWAGFRRTRFTKPNYN